MGQRSSELANSIGEGDVEISTVIPKENLQRVRDYNQYKFAKEKLAEDENVSTVMSQAFKNSFTKNSRAIKEKVMKRSGASLSHAQKTTPNVVLEEVSVNKSDNPIEIESSRR